MVYISDLFRELHRRVQATPPIAPLVLSAMFEWFVCVPEKVTKYDIIHDIWRTILEFSKPTSNPSDDNSTTDNDTTQNGTLLSNTNQKKSRSIVEGGTLVLQVRGNSSSLQIP